jgi:transposase
MQTTYEELQQQIADRDRQIAELKAQLDKALQRIDDLEAQLKRNSRNSSRPTSSDPVGSKNSSGPPVILQQPAQPFATLKIAPVVVQRDLDSPLRV